MEWARLEDVDGFLEMTAHLKASSAKLQLGQSMVPMWVVSGKWCVWNVVSTLVLAIAVTAEGRASHPRHC